jgi:hypothetical protein
MPNTSLPIPLPSRWDTSTDSTRLYYPLLQVVDLVFLAEISEEDKDVGQFFFTFLSSSAVKMRDCSVVFQRKFQQLPASMERASARFLGSWNCAQSRSVGMR